ncbi:MAG: hypothetical protein WBW88_04515, partial [Rhodothermales bacterium]
EANDVIESINGKKLDLSTAGQLFTEIGRLDAGVPYKMTVRRGDQDVEISCEKHLSEYVAHHVFTVDSTATEAQLALRRAWTHNLD